MLDLFLRLITQGLRKRNMVVSPRPSVLASNDPEYIKLPQGLISPLNL